MPPRRSARDKKTDDAPAPAAAAPADDKPAAKRGRKASAASTAADAATAAAAAAAAAATAAATAATAAAAAAAAAAAPKGKAKGRKRTADDDDTAAPAPVAAAPTASKGRGKRTKADDTSDTAAPAAPAAAAPAKGKGKGKGKAAAAAADDDDDGDDDDKKKNTNTAAAKSDAGKSSGSDPADLKKVVVKGKAAVDSHCPEAASYHVYTDASGPWDFTGNQTNIGQNNNKYYIVQLLESDSGKTYKVWTRWGRVGAPGQSMYLPAAPTDLEANKRAFCGKFRDKTQNDWYNKAHFVHHKGKYDLVKIDYAANAAEEEEELKKKLAAAAAAARGPVTKKDSQLPAAVKSLMELIFDVKRMTDTVVEMQYDIKKLPLGKLTSEQVKAGYEALKDIETLINNGASGARLADASSTFYTRIPHVFGMRVPPVINTLDMVKDKLTMLEALDDIKTAMKIISTSDTGDAEAEVDKHYKSLKCKLSPVNPADEDFKLIKLYIENTHGKTHAHYTLEIEQLFRVDKEGWTYDASLENKQLLWHGSRLTNWVGILSQGLRIAPPEAPCTGYMFGKGVYFADAVSKSANYCFTDRTRNTGLLMLCEVALGKPNERYDADSLLHTRQPPGTHSTLGKGMNAPKPDESAVVHLGGNPVKVPCGPLVPTGAKNPSGGFTLAYNEFIVYNTAQVCPRFLVRTKFNYK